MPGNRKNTAAHLNEHGYCSTPYKPARIGRRVGQGNPTRAANSYLEQPAPTSTQSQENGHLGCHSASGSTSCSRGRKKRIANRNASHARSATVRTEQQANTLAQSQENGHLGYHSASGSTSCSRGRKKRIANRNASHARSGSVGKEQQVNTLAQSQENGHLGSTSCSRGRKKRIANRNASHARSASASNQEGTSAPQSHRNSLRLQNRTSPLSSRSWNLPSTSSATNPPKTKSRKPGDDKKSFPSKRSNFSKGQTIILKGWLKANLEHPYPTESEKLVLAKKARITLIQVNNYYTNARRHSAYKKMCEDQGIVPVVMKIKKKKSMNPTSSSSKENEENQIPVRGRSLEQVPVRGRSFNPSSRSWVVIRVPIQGPWPSFNLGPVRGASFNQVAVRDESFNQVPVPGSSFNLGPSEARSFNQVPVGDRLYNQVPVPGRLFNQVPGPSDSGLSSDGSEPAFIRCSSSPASSDLLGSSLLDSPGSKSSSSEIEASQDNNHAKIEASQRNDHIFRAPAGYIGINPLQKYPCQHPAFIKGLGFHPAPPLPRGVGPEVFAVSRQVADPVYIDVPPEGSLIEALLSVAEKHRDADVKAYERNLPRGLYVADVLMAENPGAIIREREPGCDH